MHGIICHGYCRQVPMSVDAVEPSCPTTCMSMHDERLCVSLTMHARALDRSPHATAALEQSETIYTSGGTEHKALLHAAAIGHYQLGQYRDARARATELVEVRTCVRMHDGSRPACPCASIQRCAHLPCRPKLFFTAIILCHFLPHIGFHYHTTITSHIS